MQLLCKLPVYIPISSGGFAIRPHTLTIEGI